MLHRLTIYKIFPKTVGGGVWGGGFKSLDIFGIVFRSEGKGLERKESNMKTYGEEGTYLLTYFKRLRFLGGGGEMLFFRKIGLKSFQGEDGEVFMVVEDFFSNG